jgi:hypothetical protein
MTDWAQLFDHADRNPPLDPDLRDAVSGSVMAPLDTDEVAAITAAGGNPDGWHFPTRPLPASYLDFLCWSNGGFFLNGDREFQMLSAEELRPYLIDYRVPYFLPGVVPFALDGSGGFYLFDLQSPPDSAGEYPILFVRSGNLATGEVVAVAASFPEALFDSTDPAERLAL